MQDYRRKSSESTQRAVALGCAGFMVLVGFGLLGLMLAGAVALLR